MADTKEVILNIKTNFSENIDNLARLQKELDELKVAQLQVNAAVKAGTKTREEADKELEAIAAQVRNLRSEQREYRKEIDNEIKAHAENEGSIKQMRLELAAMRKEYESLSKKDRDSDAGKDMLANIQNTTEELKGLEQAQGDWRREVGHYQNALQELDPTLAKALAGFQNLSKGTMDVGVAMNNAIPKLKAFGSQMLKLATNPVVLAIVAVVVVVKQLVDQFKQTDDAMTALEQLFAAFQPILDVFNSLLEATVNVLTKVIGGITKAVTAVLSLVPAFKESSNAAQQYVKDMDALEEKERQYSVQVAKNEAEISELRAKSMQKDRYTAQQRKKFLEEAAELEKENLRMNLETDKEKLRLAREDAKRRMDTSDDTKKKLSELETNVWRSVKSYNDGMRSIEKATQRAIKEIDKLANKDITMAQFKAQKASLEKVRDAAKEMFENTDYNSKDIFGNLVFNSFLYEENKRNLDKAQADLDNYVEANESTAESNSKKLLQIAKDTSKNLIAARRAYEDAVLDTMDDSLEKQLKSVDKQYEREIESLREKLKTEENLTEEARDYINRTIDEKQKKWNEQRILTEAAYWSEVREQAKQTLSDISKMMSDFVSSDPNRVVGSFANTVKSIMSNASDEIEAEQKKINDGFIKQFEAMKEAASRLLDSNITDNERKIVQAIAEGTGEFTKENTKSIELFMSAFNRMRASAGLTEKEYIDLSQKLYPYFKRITEYYTAFASIPEKTLAKASNNVMNLMSSEAEKIRGQLSKMLDFSGVSDDVVRQVEEIVERVDEAVTKKKPVKYIDRYGFTIAESFRGSFSEVLKTISGKDVLSEQIEWIVKNYETAVSRIEKINADFKEKFLQSGNIDFRDAMIDESVIIPQLRNIYEMATKASSVQIDWEKERLEIEGRYTKEADRELKIQADLAKLEKRRAETEKTNAERQIAYLTEQRENVAKLQERYNTISVENTAEINELEQKISELREKMSSYPSDIEAEIIEADTKQLAEWSDKVERLKSAIAKSLSDLSLTGFTSTEELEEFIKKLEKTVLDANNSIISSSQNAANATTQVWLTAFTRVTGAMGTVGGAFNSLFTEMGEINEQWNDFAEATAYFTIGVSMAEGIAEAVAAGSGVPWPANIAAIASGIAAVVAGIGEALSVYNKYHSPKFAEGGLIGGRTAKTRSEGRRDDIDIKASKGEYVINAESVKRYGVDFFDMINFGKKIKIERPKFEFADGGYVSDTTIQSANSQYSMEATREMLVEAMGEIQPVVSVMEISKMQNRVKVAEKISRR